MSIIGALAPREAAICQSSIYDVDTPPGEGWTAFFEALDIVIIDTQNNRPTSLLYVEDLFKEDHYTPQWRYTISFFHPSTGWEYKLSRKLDSGTYGAIWIFRQTNVVIGRPSCIVAKFYDLAYEAKVIEYVKEVERVERMNVVDRRRRGWVPDRVPAIVKRDDWGTPCLIMARQSGDLRGVIDTPPDVALNLVKALVQEVNDMFDIYGLIAYDTKPANFLFQCAPNRPTRICAADYGGFTDVGAECLPTVVMPGNFRSTSIAPKFQIACESLCVYQIFFMFCYFVSGNAIRLPYQLLFWNVYQIGFEARLYSAFEALHWTPEVMDFYNYCTRTSAPRTLAGLYRVLHHGKRSRQATP